MKAPSSLFLPPCLLGALLACGTPTPNPWISRVHGRVVDGDTGEPIREAMVILSYSGREKLVGETLFTHKELATTAGNGAFEFPAHLSTSPAMWLWKTDERYHVSVFHGSYGWVTRWDPDRDEAGGLVLRLSLRGSLHGTETLVEHCTRWPEEWTSRQLCPFDPGAPYPNGQPRHQGDSRADCTRECRRGDWTFFYEDGSVAARGQYWGGRDVGRWEFFDREGRRTKCVGKPHRPLPSNVFFLMRSADGGTFVIPGPEPSLEPCDDVPKGAAEPPEG